MDGTMEKEPTAAELAEIKLTDVMALAMDNVRGVAYVLDTMADDRRGDAEGVALNMLANSLWESVGKVMAAKRDLEGAR